jgi:hypothetical protein
LVSRGKRVGLVTNDQAPGNVDTRFFAQQGLDVEIVLKALESVIGRRLRVTVHNLRAFRLARPRPLHRYAEPV